MTKYLYALLLVFVSTFAYAQVDTTLCSHIEEDSRYVDLLEEHRICTEREDSLCGLLSDARGRYVELKSENSNHVELQRLSSHILNLEREVLDIRTRQRGVVRGIADLEQRYIVNKRVGGVVGDGDSTDMESDLVEHTNLLQNGIIVRSLSAGSYADLKQAQQEDELMPSLVEEYISTYRSLGRYVQEYNAATNERTGDALYENCLSLRNRVDSLGNMIDGYWNHVLNAKYYAYGYILESYGLYDLLDNSSADFSNMQQICANSDGKYQLDALAHYALGRPTLVAFERDFAREMGLNMAADSLQRVSDAIEAPEYALEPITLARRSFVVYEPFTTGAKNFYNEANPIPEVPVYQRGTIYRILLGSFRSSQQSSLFKGVKPLYVTKDKSGYSYYVAGYATEQEAREAVEQLLEKGFKDPQVCCWRDGAMQNLSAPEPESAPVEVAQTSSYRYTLVLECQTMTEQMRDAINAAAPDKRIARRGSGFAVSVFSSRSEAEKLQKALALSFPSVKTTIVESNRN